MAEDPYADLKKHALKDEKIEPSFVPERLRKRRQQFTIVPGTWEERLAAARYIATYRVALYILRVNWKGGGVPFPLPNGAIPKVKTRAKWRALCELERMGLITVERRRRRSPIITGVRLGHSISGPV
jgi:hypothetical protein